MYDKFGEFSSYLAINEACANQLKEGDLDAIREIAKENGLEIIADIPRSNDIIKFEDKGMTVIEGDPDLEISRTYLALAEKLLAQA